MSVTNREPSPPRQILILVGSKFALMDLIHEMMHEGTLTPTEGWGYNENLKEYQACIEESFRMAWDRLAAFAQDARLADRERDWMLQHWRRKE